MAATIPSAALVPVALVFTNTERLALAGFLAAYGGLTRQATCRILGLVVLMFRRDQAKDAELLT